MLNTDCLTLKFTKYLKYPQHLDTRHKNYLELWDSKLSSIRDYWLFQRSSTPSFYSFFLNYVMRFQYKFDGLFLKQERSLEIIS